jgi:CDGSH-type Zn-finger protein
VLNALPLACVSTFAPLLLESSLKVSTGFHTEESLAGTKVTILNNGPLRVEGDFTVVDQDGKEFGLGGRTAVSFCRCGHTGNSPFCDGTHKRNGFASIVEARDLPPKP